MAVLRVAHVWGDRLLDVRHFAGASDQITLDGETVHVVQDQRVVRGDTAYVFTWVEPAERAKAISDDRDWGFTKVVACMLLLGSASVAMFALQVEYGFADRDDPMERIGPVVAKHAFTPPPKPKPTMLEATARAEKTITVPGTPIKAAKPISHKSAGLLGALDQLKGGYLDSLSGLVFFLLNGRWFQSKTYENLAFDRDYKSYFPLAVHKLIGEIWKPVVVYELMPGDTIRIRNMEIVPPDCLLESDEAFLDYSFVTGESKPVHVIKGAGVYAGGRLVGQPVLLKVEKRTSQSHLTSLWNEAAFQKPEESKYKRMIDLAARRFTWVVLVVALITAFGWYMYDPTRMWLVITSVLMVACPCALALASSGRAPTRR